MLKIYAQYLMMRSIAGKNQRETFSSTAGLEEITSEDISVFLKRSQYATSLSICQTAIDHMGIPIGYKAEPEWLVNLTEKEKTVFIFRYENKKGFVEIAKILDTTAMDIERTWKRAVRKVVKEIMAQNN